MTETRRPGRPRIHPPTLKMRVDQMCAHPLVRSNLTEDQRRILSPEYDPPYVCEKWEEPPHITPQQRTQNKLLRQTRRQRREERAVVRRAVKRIAQSLFNQGLLTDEPAVTAVRAPIPDHLPPPTAPRVPVTITEHNNRMLDRARNDADNDVTMLREREARIAAHVARRAAHGGGGA